MLCKLMHIFTFIVAILLSTVLASGVDESKLSAYEEKLLHNINQYRAKNALKPLSIDETLHRLAESHCQYMDKKNVLSHDNFHERFRNCRRSHCVENVGWNFTTPETQFKAWKSSRGHNANLLDKKIKYAGISKIGVYVTFFACD